MIFYSIQALLIPTEIQSLNEQIVAKPTEKPSDKPTETANGIAALPQSTPEETADEDSGGSAQLGFVVIAAIAGIVILFKRKR